MFWEDSNGFLETIKDEQRYGIFLDMGMGKTSLILALIDHKFFAENVKRVLVIAPKAVSLATWQNEMDKFENFHYMKSITELIEGPEKKRNKQLEETGTFCIHIISSGLFSWLHGKRVKKGKKTILIPNELTPDYDLIIVDECTQFKEVRTNRHKALIALAKNQLFLLSGTPFPNVAKVIIGKRVLYENADELYYLFRLLGVYKRSLTNFRLDFCFSYPWRKYKMYMDENVYDTLTSELRVWSIAKKLTLDIGITYKKVYCPIDEKRLDTLKHDYIFETDNLMNITALNKAVMINKALQLSNGFIYDHFEEKTYRINDHKFKALIGLLERLKTRAIICYNFREDKEYILNNLKGAKAYENEQDRQAWSKGKIKYLILSPFSQKHGLNLQEGGHVIIWYGLIWSAESYEQTNARIIRRGQKSNVEVYHILAEKGFDNYVFDKLVSKIDTKEKFIANFQSFEKKDQKGGKNDV